MICNQLMCLPGCRRSFWAQQSCARRSRGLMGEGQTGSASLSPTTFSSPTKTTSRSDSDLCCPDAGSTAFFLSPWAQSGSQSQKGVQKALWIADQGCGGSFLALAVTGHAQPFCLSRQEKALHFLEGIQSWLILQIEVTGATEADFRTWDGWVHSRLRQLVMRVEPYVLVR